MDLQTVILYVFDSLSDWEPSYAISGINNPAYQRFPGRFVIKTAGVSRQPVKTAGGLTILPDLTLEEIDPAQNAMLVLTGGAGWESGQHRAAIELAGRFLHAAKPVAAICGATAGMAIGGFLNDVRHTSNAAIYLQATGYRGQSYYQEEPAVTDGNIITAGATFPVEFACHIFTKLGIYTDATLKSWYGLYKTGDIKYFLELQKGA
jgi:putative intracellular protease/amidase